MIQELIHGKICRKRTAVDDWFRKKSAGLPAPFYSSYDIRDSSFKVAPVDANAFPAGFNNICQVDKENAPEIAQKYLAEHYPANFQKIMILAEEHTKNPYYWDNVKAIEDILVAAGRKTKIAIPQPLKEPLRLTSASGRDVQIHGAIRNGSGVTVAGESIDLIICNNDFSQTYEEWVAGLETPMNPPHELGWYRRRKSDFFDQYNSLAGEFAKLIEIDPWQIQVKTELYKNFDINSEESREELAKAVEKFLSEIKGSNPFVYVKNNSGTYGLGVTMVRSAEEVRNWSYKARKKMKAAKGGGGFDEVIIQEGIPTAVVDQGQTAEPAIYMIGSQLAGGFLRVHGEKGPDESLNSPGMVFKRLCVTDLKVNLEGCPMENVYGWLAKISLLAVAQEAREAGVKFKGYN